MDHLLPHYERELSLLRRHMREFSQRYPDIAHRLQIHGETCADPQIEHMIESCALLNSRTAQRLDDDYSEFTDALLEVLHPHYLRAFPSCSIAHLDYSNATTPLIATCVIARGTHLTTTGAGTGQCTFRTVYPLTLAPVALTAATFSAIMTPPATIRLPADVSSSLSITIVSTKAGLALKQLGLASLRLFIDAEPALCAALRDALFLRTVKAYVEADHSGHWVALSATPLATVGFEPDQGLIPFPADAHAAYRLLTEYFCFPEKFNFMDIDLQALSAALPPDCQSITLHLALSGVRSDSNTARLLQTISKRHLLLGCTPVVNWFELRSDPIALAPGSDRHTVLADARRAFAYEVQSIDSVKLKPAGAEHTIELTPLHSLRHSATTQHPYWTMQRDPFMARSKPGHELAITLVERDGGAARIEQGTLSLELSCSNRDLTDSLPYGLPDGDLTFKGDSSGSTIRFLRKPSASHRFQRGNAAHWRLISQLSSNYLSLPDGGLAAVKEILRAHDLTRYAISQRQISGIVSISREAIFAWMPGASIPQMVRGLEVKLTIDESAFTESAIHTFAQVIERFLSLYVTTNSFTQLVMVAKKSGAELLRCPPRQGDLSLI